MPLRGARTSFPGYPAEIVCSLCWVLNVGDDVSWVLLLLTLKVQTLTELVHCMVQCCTAMFCSKQVS